MFITRFVKKLGILGHSIQLGDMWDIIRMTNGGVVIKILQTLYSPEFVKIILLLGITLKLQKRWQPSCNHLWCFETQHFYSARGMKTSDFCHFCHTSHTIIGHLGGDLRMSPWIYFHIQLSISIYSHVPTTLNDPTLPSWSMCFSLRQASSCALDVSML